MVLRSAEYTHDAPAFASWEPAAARLRAMSRKTSSIVRAAVPADRLPRRATIDDASGAHHQNVIAEAFHFRHVVRGEHNGGAALLPISLEIAAHDIARVDQLSAVGSSSSSRRGRFSSAFAKATRVR